MRFDVHLADFGEPVTSLALGTYNIPWWAVAGAAIAFAIAAALWLFWWRFPKWQVKRRFEISDPKARGDLEDNFRKTIGQLIGGAAVLIGAGVAYYGTQQTLQVSNNQLKAAYDQIQASRDQLISQQVSKGFELLGSVNTSTKKSGDKTVIRLGGIYALEGVMNTSEQYRQPVLEALSAFVRDGTKDDKGQGPPATDIQAALTVIGRRAAAAGDVVDLTGSHIPKAQLPPHANLIGAYLRDADLSGAYLRDADLSGANLWAADLSGAHLYGAKLSGANLYDAKLSAANLTSADLSGANLIGANLIGAVLWDANLSGADLSGARLTAADLSSAKVLQNQLDKACGGNSTKLPAGMTIKECK